MIPKTTQSVAAFQTGRYPVTNGVRILKGSLKGSEQTRRDPGRCRLHIRCSSTTAGRGAEDSSRGSTSSVLLAGACSDRLAGGMADRHQIPRD